MVQSDVVGFRFGEFELDVSLFELRHQGERVQIDRKVFDLLCYLVEHRERVVTKEELLQQVWHGEAVVEAVVPTAVARLRRALQQSGARGGPIETAHGRGYRFAAEVRHAGDSTAPAGEIDTDLHPDLRDAFVGRERLMRRLEGALSRAEDGRTQVRLLFGEPGIGKSRAAREITARAKKRGIEAWLGRCRPDDGGARPWLWVQIIRQLRDELGDAGVAALPADQRQALIALLPELAGPGAPASPPFGREHFDALARLLRTSARHGTRLLVLDDIHWADALSLSLLAYLSEALGAARILIVATVRDTELPPEHPSWGLIERIERAESGKRVPLSPLSREAVAEYVHILWGHAPEAPVAEALHLQTAGNPLWVREAARTVLSRWLAGEAPDPATIRAPPNARDAVRARLEALDEQTREVVEAAAVIGQYFELPVLQRVLRAEPGALLRALDRAERARLIERTEDESGALCFAHPMLRDTIYGGLSSALRCKLHLQVAEVFEQQRPLQGRATAEIATHLHRALPHGEAARVVDYGLRAARHAQQQGDPESAAQWLARAYEGLCYADQADPALAAELMVELGRSHAQEGRTAAAREALSWALELASRNQEAALFAAAAERELSALDAPGEDDDGA